MQPLQISRDVNAFYSKILIGKDNFMVTVYPNIDYAFVVALIVILDPINQAF